MNTISQRNQDGPSMPERGRELEILVRCRVSGWVRDFQLVLTEQGIILRGHAQTFYAKQLAQHAVMKATHLPIVANQIEVR